jgi:Domain of unknown function (DUF4124)
MNMKKLILIILLLPTVCTAKTLYKCTVDGGKVIFQPNPCPDGASAKTLEIKELSPEAKLRVEHEAQLRKIDELAEQKSKELEAIKQANIDAARAKERAWNQINQESQASQERLQQMQQQQQRWQWEANCRNASGVTVDQECFDFLNKHGGFQFR